MISKEQVDEIAASLLACQPLLGAKLVAYAGVKHGGEHEAITEVLCFLHLCSLKAGVLTPSQKVDDVWHQMILFTRSYVQLCQEHFGEFMHHQPSNQPVLEHQQYAKALLLYCHHFGTPPPEYWPAAGICTSECGSCEG